MLELPLRPGIACLLAFGALLSAACDRQKAAEPQGGGPGTPLAKERSGKAYPTGRLDRSNAGSAAPSGAFQDAEGRETTLAEFRGRPLLLNLWATWCPPCVVEMPSLDRLAVRDGERIQVAAISQDLDGRDKVDRFFARTGLRHLEAFLDGDMALMTALRVGTLPTTILYDARGREVWRMTGPAEWDGEGARRLLAEADRR